MQITLGQQFNVGEKPTVILYIYLLLHLPRTASDTEVKNKSHTRDGYNRKTKTKESTWQRGGGAQGIRFCGLDWFSCPYCSSSRLSGAASEIQRLPVE